MNNMSLQNRFYACLAMGLLLAGIGAANGAATPAKTELSAKLEPIQQEAYTLKQESKTASPEELKQIDKRAGELLDQLRVLGLPVPRVIPRIPSKIGKKAKGKTAIKKMPTFGAKAAKIKSTKTAASNPPGPGLKSAYGKELASPPEPGKLKLGKGMKTLPGKTLIPNQSATSLRKPQTLAKLSPRKLGLKFELKDANLVKTLKLKAGKSSEAIFSVMNSGDSASKATTYSVKCKKLSNAASKCPTFKKRETLTVVIGPQGSQDIKVKLTSLVAGEYELELKLANGASQMLKLKVAAAKLQINPTTLKSTPKVQPKPRLRLH